MRRDTRDVVTCPQSKSKLLPGTHHYTDIPKSERPKYPSGKYKYRRAMRCDWCDHVKDGASNTESYLKKKEEAKKKREWQDRNK